MENKQKIQLFEKLEALQYALLDLDKSLESSAAKKASKSLESSVASKAAKSLESSVAKKAAKSLESSAAKKASKSLESSAAKKASKSVRNEENYDFTTINGIGKKIDGALKDAGFINLEIMAAEISHLKNFEDKKSALKKVLKATFFNSRVLEKLVTHVESKSK